LRVWFILLLGRILGTVQTPSFSRLLRYGGTSPAAYGRSDPGVGFGMGFRRARDERDGTKPCRGTEQYAP
jgi:hypothetical protein